MQSDAGLSAADAGRVVASLRRLHGNGLADFAVTGGVATAAHLAAEMDGPRPLADLDLVVAGTPSLPEAVARGFLVSHAHLGASPGRMLLQLVDPAAALRVDVFGSVGGQLGRSHPGPGALGGAPIVSRGDLVARLTRLLLDLALGEPVPAKHARDWAALVRAGLDDAGPAWADHRRERHPERFGGACRAVEELVRTRADLLVGHSPYMVRDCPLCRETESLRMSPAGAIVAVLGYR